MVFSHEQQTHFPSDRFWDTAEHGILYRPEIVAAIKTKLSDGRPMEGLFVRGPHGVGKSHSLVNLVLNLRSEGHIVAFIPTCEKFRSDDDILEALLRSIGSSMSDIGIDGDWLTSTRLKRILDLIENTLPDINRNCFFVFDQLNRIFARGYQDRKDVGVLPMPFRLMKHLNDRKRKSRLFSQRL